MEVIMTKNAIPILCALYDCEADDEFSAVTINDIIVEEK